MQDSQDGDLFLANLVDSNERERRKGNLSRAVDATRTSEVRERFQCADAFDYGLRHSSGGLGTILSDVVADPFEIIGCVRGPTDAHQPRYL
jgi:hypothetical protein